MPSSIAVVLLLAFFALPLDAAKIEKSSHMQEIPEGPKIKVLLEKDVGSALLEVRGKYRVVRKDTGSVLSSGSTGKRFVVHALQQGLRWGEEYPDVYQISVVPQSPNTLLYVNGMQYKGAVSIYHVRDNQITIVNEVPIEDYLKSTLALKFEKPLVQEAMAALAIIGRTEIYSLISYGKASARPWDVVAKEVGYWGHGVTRQTNGVDKAVEQTRFMVMESMKDGRVVQKASLSISQAEELAMDDFDAKRILKTSFPFTRIGVTVNPDEVALR